jgi:hypothetical protein
METGGPLSFTNGSTRQPSRIAACLIAVLTSALVHFTSLSVQAQDGDSPPASPAFEAAIRTMQAVGSEGEGNAAAATAWATLTEKAGANVLPELLTALNDASPLAANWLRTAAQVIIEREQAAGRPLPLDTIGGILLDSSGGVTGRVSAFEIIEQVQPETASRLVPGFLRDPSRELRRRAVAQLIELAKSQQESSPAAATLLYRQALSAATDVDQVQAIAIALEKNESAVDLPKHFGFLTHWHVVAPFDNTDRSGFAEVFPPENGVDLDASYPGKNDGETISWQPFATTDPYGKVDFNLPFTPLKEVTAYAYTEFESETDRPAELRIGCKNGWKIWFNGEFIFGRDEYHRGQRIDQYRMPVQLKKGKNTVLVKACQDGQEQNWTVEWEFQLRVCDSSGVAILAPDRLPTPVKKATSSRRGAGAKDTRDN